MRALHIRLLGPMEFHLGEKRLPSFKARKSKALFSYLILHRGRIVPRERAAAEFWGDLPENRARNALNTAYWRINQTLREAGVHPDQYLQSDASGIGFLAKANYSLDVELFEQSLQRCARLAPEQASNEDIRDLSAAVTLYRGDLLEGIFDDWCLLQRERFRSRYMHALELLLRIHMQRQQWERAIEQAQRLLAMDPLQEHIHRALMRCYYLEGNRAGAVRQYAACVQLLRRELQVEPMEETTRVYQTIMAVAPAAGEPRPSSEAAPRRPARKTPLEEVNLALANLETARGWLIDASEQMSQAPPKHRQ